MEPTDWSLPATPASDDGESTEGAWVWPLAIVLFLAVVMAVNATYSVVAVSGADPVVESYMTEER